MKNKGLVDGIRPDEIITVSEWADKNRILSSIAASEPGKWRTSRTPYLKKPMDCLSNHYSYSKVVMMCGSQLGKTEAGNNWIGYVIDNSPAPMLIVMPTDTAIKKNSKTRIDPMIESTPSLKTKVKELKSRSGENTIEQKNFPGGVLFMVGANSPVGLSSTPIKNVFLDEVDRFPSDVAGEGSPIGLAEARTRTFPNKKIFETSTPTIKGYSQIESEFELTDQNYYHVPCPHCGHMHVFVFENLKWDEGNTSTAKMVCPECGVYIEERYKTQMLEKGEWIPSHPELTSDKTIGFHINSLYSPLGWFSWGDIAEYYNKAQKDPALMKVFVNTILGVSYEESGEAPAWENLFNKSRTENLKPNEIPASVCFLTAGVDIQQDRIELEIVGWCADKQTYSIDYRVLDGNTSLPDVWEKLDSVINETWVREDGIEMGLRMTAIDTGYLTTKVYSFCRKYSTSKVIPIKGNDGLGIPVAPPKQIDYNKSGKKIGRTKVWNIGVSILKSELYSWLLLDPNTDGTYPPSYCHFVQWPENYFRGITAEQWLPKEKKWKKVYTRNEPLDCRIYARAAANIVGLDRMKPEQLMAIGGIVAKSESKNKNKKEKRKKTSDFWD